MKTTYIMSYKVPVLIEDSFDTYLSVNGHKPSVYIITDIKYMDTLLLRTIIPKTKQVSNFKFIINLN